ncbi:MAG: DoxX family protein [Patescibacteria group bacterium]
MKNKHKIIRIVLQVLLSLSFLAGGVSKLMGSADQVTSFAALHLETTLVAIGLLEVLIAIAVWCKQTRTIAILFATAIMGAAVAATISLSQGINAMVIVPGAILLMGWAILSLDRCSCENCSAPTVPTA